MCYLFFEPALDMINKFHERKQIWVSSCYVHQGLPVLIKCIVVCRVVSINLNMLLCSTLMLKQISVAWRAAQCNDPWTHSKLAHFSTSIYLERNFFSSHSVTFTLQPELASKKTCGLGELLYYSLMKCDEKVRSKHFSTILLADPSEARGCSINSLIIN